MRLNIRFSGGKRADFGDHNYEDVLSSALDRFRHRLKQVLHLAEANHVEVRGKQD